MSARSSPIESAWHLLTMSARSYPIESAWHLLTVLLRLGRPARLTELASHSRLAPDLFTRLCRSPGSPLLLTDDGLVTVTNSVFAALVRFLSKAVAPSVPRVAVTAAGERRGCSVIYSSKRKVPPGDDVAVPAAKRVLFMDNLEGIGLPSLGRSLPTETLQAVPYVSRNQQVLENNVHILSFANHFFLAEYKKLIAFERAARVEVERLKAELQVRDSSLATKESELAEEKKKADELCVTLDEVVTTVVSKAQGELMMEYKAGRSNEWDVEAEIAIYQELLGGG